MYYVSESTTADRKGSGSSYVAISGHLTQAEYKKIIADGQNYNTLQEAYDAYEKELTLCSSWNEDIIHDNEKYTLKQITKRRRKR